jgi:hypothetical protein
MSASESEPATAEELADALTGLADGGDAYLTEREQHLIDKAAEVIRAETSDEYDDCRYVLECRTCGTITADMSADGTFERPQAERRAGFHEALHDHNCTVSIAYQRGEM